MVIELAGFAAAVHRDHFDKCSRDKMKMRDVEASLLRVCKRIAALESSLRGHATDVPLMAADIAASCETLGERRREELRSATDQKVKMIVSKFGHCVSFILHIDPPTCNKCIETVRRGDPLPKAWRRCGIDSGVWRCSKCVRRSHGRSNNYWSKGRNLHDSLSPSRRR